jgi:phage terminase large subunit
MTAHELKIYIELYKRKEYQHIPIGAYPNGEYFYMTPKQVRTMELLNDDITTDVGYGGSARSGKSLIECTAIIFDCLTYPDIAWGLSRKELTTLKRTVLLTLFKQFEFYGIKDFKTNKGYEFTYNYNQELNKITFQNKSDIFLIDTAYKPSDPLNTRFGGFELTRSAIDESNETELSIVYKLFERTGWRNNDKYNLKRKQFECFNPAKNHVYTRYYLPFKDQKESDHKRFIPALPADNPHPSVKEWIDDLVKTGDEVTIQRQILGNFDYDDDPSALCKWDAICDLFTNDHILTGEKRISADLAMQGRDKFIAGYWEGLKCTVAIDKPKSTGRDIELSLKELKINMGVGNSNIVADSDGLGNYLESYIQNIKTFHGNGSAKNKKEFSNIKSECGFKLAEYINNRKIKIVCSPFQHEEIKKELSMCLKRENVDGDTSKKQLISKEKMKEISGHSPDYLDMLLMYMIFYVKEEVEFTVTRR